MASHLLGSPPSMRYLLIALTLTASAAQAQTLTLQASNTTGDTLRLKADSCDIARTVNWNITAVTTFCEDMNFWLTKSSSCTDTVASGDTPLSDSKVSVTLLRSGTRADDL